MMGELITLAILNIDDEADQIFMVDLYSNYYNLMYKKALAYVKNPHDAQDIVHDAYEKLIEKISTLRKFNRYTLTSYIVFTIENISLNFIKRRDKQADLVLLYEDGDGMQYVPDTETPEKIFFEKDGAKRLRKAIDQLKPKYRLALDCKYFQDMSDKEIAEIIGIKPESVREYLSRARNMVHQILTKEYDLSGIE